MIKNTRIVIVVGVLILLLGVGISVLSKLRERGGARNEKLLSLLPTAVAGWDVTDMPIASSVEMQKAVNELLNYDQAVFREYRRGNSAFTVYAAYWKPRRFHPRLISIHTPDICWAGNGWTVLKADYNYNLNLAKGPAWHAQSRVFQASGQLMNVLYWHILDGRLSGYAEGPNSSSRSIFDTFGDDIRHGSGEQFFIRLSSPQPWSEWHGDPLFNQIINTFSPVLLAH